MTPDVNLGTGWEIVAVRYGVAHSSKSSLYHRFRDYGELDAAQDMDFFFYVLTRGDQVVLVDCGFSTEEADRRPGREVIIAPAEALARLGVDPAAVSDVVISHIHWDHIGNLDLFPNARLHAPQTELEFWASPASRRLQFVEHVDLPATERLLERYHAGQVLALGATAEPLPGVRTTEVGGHAPGQQIIEVESSAGPIVLASDAAHLYEELELERPFGVLADLGRMYLAYEHLKELEAAGALVVAGHDPLVSSRFPTLGDDASGIGYRIA